ncbi:MULTISPECIES: stage III sporulation protein AF [unclassified Cytobacillus]|uniref:stage III sporulation protein AF n=1 Tax=unclassified Cytobacillus TaxID=2675268 RepID=UPI001357A69E|nr:stage III sporulation protein AF [Cytobacillus sp. AMY 15.2]KAF0818440.1 Stage III sporulation protein AF [Bacillus sp. ZZV12-4809]MCM3091518.1 stage III sporulation protein AF [Cytobacillus sp. AMY 15.2]
MDFIKEWVTNIILFVLLATVIDMLLPSSKLQKYTKMVTGLLLIAIILTPILKIVSSDFEEALVSVPVFEGAGEKNMENLIEMKKKEIQASSDAYILEQMAVHMKQDAEEELMEQYGLEIANIDILVDESSDQAFPDNLQKVMIQLKAEDAEAEAVEVVKTVEINAGKPLPSSGPEHEDAGRIASLLAQKWNVDANSIEVLVEGGNMERDG